MESVSVSNDRERVDDAGAPITEQASAWWITLNAGEATPEDHEAFREWAERSPERIEAFLETARLTRVLKSRQIRWPETSQDELARQAHEEKADVISLSHFSGSGLRTAQGQRASALGKNRPSSLTFVVAASLLGVLAGLWIALKPAHRYDTGTGELRSIPLEDGSIVTLNTASRIEVKFDKHRRSIQLLAGEALFQVARDSTRPFDVIAGNATVRAVGTQFNVYLRPRGTVVTVVEGRVAVLSDEALRAPQPSSHDGAGSDPKATRPRQAPRDSAPMYLSEGEQLTVERREGRPARLERPADVAVVTAWTQRQLVFDHRPIGEVAEEFNRYNELQIRIEGHSLRNEQMTGVFKANDPESFLAFVGRMPGVKIERSPTSKEVLASN